MDNREDIQRSIGRLEGIIKVGFKEINRRLDEMSGTIIKHADEINELETFRDEYRGQEKQITKIAGIAGAIMGGFTTAVVWIINHFWSK